MNVFDPDSNEGESEVEACDQTSWVTRSVIIEIVCPPFVDCAVTVSASPSHWSHDQVYR